MPVEATGIWSRYGWHANHVHAVGAFKPYARGLAYACACHVHVHQCFRYVELPENSGDLGNLHGSQHVLHAATALVCTVLLFDWIQF